MTATHSDGTCVYHGQIAEALKEIREDTKAILARLSKGDVTFATIELRVERLERIVYGVCGLVLTEVVVAVLYLILCKP